MIDTSIHAELLASYERASYHVEASPSFILKIGRYSPELHSMYEASSKKRAAFITAYNPGSIELSNEDNKERNQRLEEKIQTLLLDYIYGESTCDESEWTGEKSFLILGIKQEEAISLGKEFGQNAIVWINQKAIPELLLLK